MMTTWKLARKTTATKTPLRAPEFSGEFPGRIKGVFLLEHDMPEKHQRLYWIWAAMIQRCSNPRCRGFTNYGARGIFVCEEWKGSKPFLEWAIANGYDRSLQLDRIDNDGPYCPSNCQFVTRSQNLSHTRHNVFASAFGETKTLRQWSRDVRCRCSYRRLGTRIRRGWNTERAITTIAKDFVRRDCLVVAFGETKRLREWIADSRCSISVNTLRARLFKLNWSPEQAIATSRLEPAFRVCNKEPF